MFLTISSTPTQYSNIKNPLRWAASEVNDEISKYLSVRPSNEDHSLPSNLSNSNKPVLVTKHTTTYKGKFGRICEQGPTPKVTDSVANVGTKYSHEVSCYILTQNYMF